MPPFAHYSEKLHFPRLLRSSTTPSNKSKDNGACGIIELYSRSRRGRLKNFHIIPEVPVVLCKQRILKGRNYQVAQLLKSASRGGWLPVNHQRRKVKTNVVEQREQQLPRCSRHRAKQEKVSKGQRAETLPARKAMLPYSTSGNNCDQSCGAAGFSGQDQQAVLTALFEAFTARMICIRGVDGSLAEYTNNKIMKLGI